MNKTSIFASDNGGYETVISVKGNPIDHWVLLTLTIIRRINREFDTYRGPLGDKTFQKLHTTMISSTPTSILGGNRYITRSTSVFVS